MAFINLLCVYDKKNPVLTLSINAVPKKTALSRFFQRIGHLPLLQGQSFTDHATLNYNVLALRKSTIKNDQNSFIIFDMSLSWSANF